MSPKTTSGVAGVILAGGRARRMGGGDKCLHKLGEKPLIGHVIERARPQVSRLVVNANGDRLRLGRFGLPVIADVVGDFAGPLAGILSGLEWARDNAPECPWVASFATDTPFFPCDLVERLCAAVDNQTADIACAASDGRAHPVFGLWPVRLAGELRRALEVEEVRKIDLWTARYRLATVEFPAEPRDPFFNVNRPDDLEIAKRMLA